MKAERNISMSQIDIFKTEWETNDDKTLRRGAEKFSVVLKKFSVVLKRLARGLYYIVKTSWL